MIKLQKIPLLKEFYYFTSVSILLEKLWWLLDRYVIEYLVYYTFSIKYRVLGDMFFI